MRSNTGSGEIIVVIMALQGDIAARFQNNRDGVDLVWTLTGIDLNRIASTFPALSLGTKRAVNRDRISD